MAKAAQNIHWVPQEEKDANGDCNSIGERNENIYRITRAADGTFTATHFTIHELVQRTLAEGVTGRMAWRKCVDHHNENYIPPTA